jgi:hypothetical protein
MDITQYLATQELALPIAPMILLGILIVLIIVKGMALYKAARLKEKGWFWVMLLINSMGIIPGIYLYIRRKKRV